MKAYVGASVFIRNLRPDRSKWSALHTSCFDSLQKNHPLATEQAQLVEALRYKPEGCGFDSRWRYLHNPGVDSFSKTNDYQKYFLEGKGGRCIGLTALPPSCADCLEIWEPQLPGTFRAGRDPQKVCVAFFRTHCTECWVVLKSRLDVLKKRLTFWRRIFFFKF